MEPRDGEACVAENLARAEFAAASCNACGMMVRDAQAASDQGRGRHGSISKSEDAVNGQSTLRFKDNAGCGIGCLEMHGEGLVVPGVVESPAAIGDKGEFNAQFLSCGVEGTSLVAQLCGKDKDMLL